MVADLFDLEERKYGQP